MASKPLFIKHRSKNEIDEAKSVNIEELPHPENDDERVKNPKYLVLIGVCTHLGCVPASDKGDFKVGFALVMALIMILLEELEKASSEKFRNTSLYF